MPDFKALKGKKLLAIDDIPAFQDQLLEWYRHHRRDLPWRRTQDPYAIMVSELMLQQTQVKTVIPYFERFMTLFPTPLALSKASDEVLLNAWQGLGYYRRARHLREAARMIVDDFAGTFPSTKAEIDQLKGVGAYTSAAVASIAFQLAHACVDGNVIRVISRLSAFDDDVSKTAAKNTLQRMADQLIHEKHPGDFNQAMMELGATVCTPRKPTCMTCPVNAFCRTLQQGDDPLNRPFKSKKPKAQKVGFRSLLCASNGKLLLARRPDKGLMADMWELPTQFAAEFEEWENHLDGSCEWVTQWEKPVVHKFTHLHASYVVDVYRSPEPLPWTNEPTAYAATDWFSPREIEDIPITKVLQKVLALCAKGLNLKDETWQKPPSPSHGPLLMNIER